MSRTKGHNGSRHYAQDSSRCKYRSNKRIKTLANRRTRITLRNRVEASEYEYIDSTLVPSKTKVFRCSGWSMKCC